MNDPHNEATEALLEIKADLKNIAVMRAAAVAWLRYDSGCLLVALERSPLPRDACNPDVIGVTKRRMVVEIEIKRTMADLRANFEKSSMQHRERRNIGPTRFYYLVPPEMVDKAFPLIAPTGCGLLTLGGYNPYSGLPGIGMVHQATPVKRQPLSLKQIVKMVSHQTGTLASALTKLAKV